MPISFYLFANPNSRLYLSNPFSLSQSVRCISTYVCIYLLSIHLFFFIPLCQSRLIPISFNPIFFLSLILIYPPVSIFISFLSTTITFYLLFIQIYMYLFQLLSPSLNLSFVHLPISFSICLPIQIHGYIFQTCLLYLSLFFVYPPIFVSTSCLSTSISLYLFVNPD